jgi:hypothetical protein
MKTQTISSTKTTVSAYNYHDGYYYHFDKTDKDRLHMNRIRIGDAESEHVIFQSEHRLTSVDCTMRTTYLCCHPEQNTLYLSIGNTYGSNLFEICIDTRKVSVLGSIDYLIMFMSVVDNRLFVLTKKRRSLSTMELSIYDGRVIYKGCEYLLDAKIFITRRNPDKSEQLIMPCISPRLGPVRFLRVYDPVIMGLTTTGIGSGYVREKHSSSGYVRENRSTNEFHFNAECLPNGDVCMSGIMPHTLHVFSFDMQKWIYVEHDHNDVEFIQPVNQSIFCVRCKDDTSDPNKFHLIPINKNQTCSTTQKFLDEYRMMSIVLSESGSDLRVEDFPDGKTQINKYLCGMEVLVKGFGQLLDFLRFVIAIDDKDMARYSMEFLQEPDVFKYMIDELVKSFKLLSFTNILLDARAKIESAKIGHDVKYKLPQIAFRDRLNKILNHLERDLLVVSGSVSIPVHSLVFEMSSGYFHALHSFQNEPVQTLDLTGLVDEHLLEPFIQFVYDNQVCSAWEFSLLIEMLVVSDSLCCDALVDRLTNEMISKLSIGNIPEAISAWSECFSHIDVIRECCEKLIDYTPKSFSGHQQASEAYELHTKDNSSRATTI